ncbi:MAG TPA: hypothetical protein VF589_01865 [Allosphingosinicella sp.]|jgi:hypothetical protein
MRKSGIAALGAASLLLTLPLASAAHAKAASVYVQCDGSPNNVSAAETALRIIALTAVIGLLAPPPEQADTSKRVAGAAGVSACTAALEGGETNVMRRMELTLARAIHRIEAGDHERAIADARSIGGIAGALAQDRGFQRSIALTALEIEAAALLRQGKRSEAELAALRMAALAPYDIANAERASYFLWYSDANLPAKLAFYDNYVKLRPEALISRSQLRAWAGDFRGSARDMESLVGLVRSASAKAADSPTFGFDAQRAVAYTAAGDLAQGDAIAAQTRAAIDRLVAAGKTVGNVESISRADELLQFQKVMRLLAAGDVAGARTAFAARTRWLAPPTPVLESVLVKLRQNLEPALMTGALADDPALLRKRSFDGRVQAVIDEPKNVARLFRSVRPLLKPADFKPAAKSVWRVEGSKYLLPRTTAESASSPFQVIYARDSSGHAAGYALLLHAALLARDRGKQGFVMFPVRKRLEMAIVRFANAGEAGVAPDLIIDAAATINALSPDMPHPGRTK